MSSFVKRDCSKKIETQLKASQKQKNDQEARKAAGVDLPVQKESGAKRIKATRQGKTNIPIVKKDGKQAIQK